jgi:exopolysaccharide biosynthesis polyprenyl glycosylphosphotransferase
MHRAVVASDVFIAIFAFLTAYFVKNYISQFFVFLKTLKNVDFINHAMFLPLYLAIILYFLTYFNSYRHPRGTPFLFYFWSVLKAVSVSLTILFTILFLLKIDYVSRVFISLFATFAILGHLLIRYWAIRYFRISVEKGQNITQILIVGTGPRAQLVSEKLSREISWGFSILGYIDPDPSFCDSCHISGKVLGSIREIHKILKENVIDEVIIAIPRSMIEAVEYVFYACEEEGVRVRFMADFFDFRVARVRVVDLADIPMLTLEPIAQDEIKLVFKRIIDLTASLLVLPFLLISTAVIAVAIKMDSPGPVFFVQERVGWKKRRFQMYKFRSMVDNAEALMQDLENLNEARGPNFEIANDPRVTRVGRFLRRTSLDELPQLFNVIKGDMSLVGPRPMSIRDVELFDLGIQRKRFSVKPGVTCFWQISGRSDLPFSEWLELDLKYINNWSLSLDFIILMKTVPAVLLRKGAV